MAEYLFLWFPNYNSINSIYQSNFHSYFYFIKRFSYFNLKISISALFYKVMKIKSNVANANSVKTNSIPHLNVFYLWKYSSLKAVLLSKCSSSSRNSLTGKHGDLESLKNGVPLSLYKYTT